MWDFFSGVLYKVSVTRMRKTALLSPIFKFRLLTGVFSFYGYSHTSGGFYCPSGSQKPTRCKYPNYCPPNSTRELPCKLGYQALNTSKLRAYHDDHCQECVAGTYGNHPRRLFCGQCPAGFFCPNGTKGPFDNLCPEGAYCPAGVGEAQACPPGTYGNRSRATKESDCFPCPANTFNNLENQRACLPCGSSSVSAEGQTLCTCLGQSRSFQSSDGACVCLLGYVFDDPSSREREDGDSDLDCRPMVCNLHFVSRLSH